MIKIGWFSDGKQESDRDVLAAVESSIRLGEVDAIIDFVCCVEDKDDCGESDRFAQLADDYNIPLLRLTCKKSHSDGNSDCNNEISKKIGGYEPNLNITSRNISVYDVIRDVPFLIIDDLPPDNLKATLKGINDGKIGIENGKPIEIKAS